MMGERAWQDSSWGMPRRLYSYGAQISVANKFVLESNGIAVGRLV
jgi:hypothetical protein